MELFVPRITGIARTREGSITLVRDRRPIIEEGAPILSELRHLMHPITVDYRAPAKGPAKKGGEAE